MKKFKPVIFGFEGYVLTDQEIKFFKEVNPLGFILFKRNVENPEQLKNLTDSLKECLGRNCPILIDQEGGKVARLRPPFWQEFPAMEVFANIATDNLSKAEDECYKNALNLGNVLKESGINVNCAPVCDLYYDYADEIIGNRSFGNNVDIVTSLANKTAQGLIDSKVLPIIKHIPGHGRALCDSHKELPVVDTCLDELENSDFKVFNNLKDAPWAMTAHIVYSCLDSELPATQSKIVIDYIRNQIGFDGLLVSDDLSMEALKGDYTTRMKLTLDAGCDIALHCNGNMQQMKDVAHNLLDANNKTIERFDNSFNKIC